MTDLTVFRQYAPDELGGDDYPIEWHKFIKFAVRQDAGFRCERCCHPYERGMGEWSICADDCAHKGPTRHTFGGLVEAQWRILTVHHLDGIKSNCRWWNLAALCQRCHLTIQGKVTMAQTYPFEHSEWFKAHAAGYYALVYLGEELTREQTMERLDELLALELVS